MKLVDEKGKLFGKINIIDLLVLLLVLAALALVGWKVMGNRSANIGDTTKITYTTFVSNVSKSVYDEVSTHVNLAEGKRDQMMANGKMLDAYVIDVVATPHVSYSANAEGKTVVSFDEGPDSRLDLTFTMEAQVDNTTINKVGTQEVRTGKSHIVKTVNFEFAYGIVYGLHIGE